MPPIINTNPKLPHISWEAALQLKDYSPQRVEVSIRKSCRIEFHNNNPVLASRHDVDIELAEWGIGTGGSMANAKQECFDIVLAKGKLKRTWTWSWTKDNPEIISVEDQNATHSYGGDSMTIHFAKESLAFTWFMWLQEYGTKTVTEVSTRPENCGSEVLVIRTIESWLQKTPNSIQHGRSTHGPWETILGGHSQSSQVHEACFTYVRNSRMAFVSVRRSRDAIVDERFTRPDNKGPTISRRFCFKTKAEAEAWYDAWKDIATNQKGINGPVQLIRTHIYPDTTLLISNRKPVFSSALWPEIPLHNWGIYKAKTPVSRVPGIRFTVASETSQWTWERHRSQLKIYTANTFLHHWSQDYSLTLNFSDSESCRAWFSYLEHYTNSGRTSVLPRAEHITLIDGAVRWMQQETEKGRIQTRGATSESWKNMFGSCKNYELNESYLAITDTSKFLPHIRVTQNGCELIQKRMTSVKDARDIPLTTTYKFPTSDDAAHWYNAWKESIKRNLI